jgi:hypothetical protein
VNPVVVIVVDLIANEPPPMLFVQRDDMLENFVARVEGVAEYQTGRAG